MNDTFSQTKVDLVHAPLSISGWMRYDIIRRHLNDHVPASTLELGIGVAGMSSLLPTNGYVGVEPDATSRRIARERLPGRRVVASLDDVDGQQTFDLVCAFEVIEHIRDHHESARLWSERVAPGGHLILSTPANSARFDAWDRAAGHFRRYDPVDIEHLVDATGLERDSINYYGFPVGHALESMRNRVASRSDRMDKPMDEVTAASARQLQPPTWSSRATQLVGTGLARIQRPFQTPSRATGVVVIARRPPER